MGEGSNNAKRRRVEDLQATASALAHENTRRFHALPEDMRPGTAAVTVLKVETLVALWTAGDPEREAEFSVAYQQQLALALRDLEAKTEAGAKAAAASKLIRPAGNGGIVTPIGVRPPGP